MDEEISIINEKTRNERIKIFFIDNKKKIITFFFLILIVFIGFFGVKEYKDSKKKKISDEFNSVVIDYSSENLDLTKERLKSIVKQKDPTYSPLSLYFIIDNDLAESREEVNKLFNILINKTNLKDEIKSLIIYKKALYNADFIDEDELLDIVRPILNSKSIWKSHTLYLVAEYFYSKDEKKKSKEFFDQIISLDDSNQDILKETQKRLNRDFSE